MINKDMNASAIGVAWKVLRIGFDGVLLSAISGPGETEYPRENWKRRTDFKNYGPYALFATVEAAFELKEQIKVNGEHAVVYLVEYELSKDTELWVGNLCQPHMRWMYDNIYADAVRLIRGVS